MATGVQKITQPQSNSQEKSTLPALVLLVGWLVPGAGHLLLGKWVRGLLLFASILGMYLIGLGLQGKIYTPNTGDILDILGFIGQLGMGLLYFIARWFGLGATQQYYPLLHSALAQRPWSTPSPTTAPSSSLWAGCSI